MSAYSADEVTAETPRSMTYLDPTLAPGSVQTRGTLYVFQPFPPFPISSIPMAVAVPCHCLDFPPRMHVRLTTAVMAG